jgi:acyl dehydratase
MGKYFDEISPDDTIKHRLAKTITEAEHILFCGMTLNTQPLHINAVEASKSEFGQQIVNGLFTLGLAIGITVPELTEGTIVANLGYDSIVHPNPVFHGDTLFVETFVLEKRLSKSRPDCGVVRFKHVGRNQNGDVVIEVNRTALMKTKPKESHE